MSGDDPSARVDDRGRHRPVGSRARLGVRIVCVVAGLVSVCAFLGYGYAWYNYTSLDHKLQRRAIHVAPVTAPRATNGRTKHVSGVEQNLLIVGDDSRDGLTRKQQKQLHVGSADGANSTDTIMIAHVPADGSNATLISIPRDSWVQIPGYGMGKINSAYDDGYRDAPGAHPSTKDRQQAGADELIATVTKLTGLGINHYVQVGFGGFYTIAKAIGGIDVTLCEAVDDTAARNQAEGQIAGSGFEMSAGRHHLNPTQALEFVRQRHNLPGPNGNDIGREKRQQYFLAQALEQVTSGGELLNPIRLHNLINTITAAFFIDGNFRLQDFADQMLDLNAQHIVGHTIPIVNVNGHVGDLSVVLVDPRAVKVKVAAMIANTSAAPSSPRATAAPKTARPTSSAPTPSQSPTSRGCIY